MTSESAAPSLFARAGGSEFFDRLVGAFYVGVAADEVLAPLYPDYPDFAPATRRLSLFLQQYWGGPTTYSDERGHPRLRMRHHPVPVDLGMRDAWLRCMNAALDERGVEGPLREFLSSRFAEVADFLRNRPG